MNSINHVLAFGMPGGPEWVFIFIIILLFFGAAKLPELAKGLGLAIKEFKKASKEVTDELEVKSDDKPPEDRKNNGGDKPPQGMTPALPEEPPPSYTAAKPFLEHLEDLRWTLIKSIAAYAISTIACFVFRLQILNILTAPLFRYVSRDSGFLSALGVADSFMISIKVAAFAGIIFSLPFILYFFGQFFLPALKASEKRMMFPVFASGVFLFIAGVLACYYFLLPVTLQFFISDSAYMGIHPQWTIQNYISFVTQFAVGMGLSFEMPVVIVTLAKLGIITHEFLKQKRRYFIVAIFFLAACITPTSDIFTMTVVAAPLIILYEICVWVAWSIERGRKVRKA